MAKADDEDAILAEARARFKEATDADAINRAEALDDVKFVWNLDDWQWPQEAKIARRGRPCLTENRLPQFLRQIVNAQRQNRPSINVAPANSGAAPAVATVMEGMIRHIEQWSKADLAYDSAFEDAVSASIGYFRITTEYAEDESFDQEICIRPIDNLFSVYDDPQYTMPDGSDRKWCFVTEMVDRDEFEEEYGFTPTAVDAALGDDRALWFTDDEVRVAEYWRVRVERSSISDPANPKRKRDVERKVVEQYLMTGDRIIKRSDWLGTMIPIIPVYGEVRNIEGKRYRKSLIRDAKSPQRVNNYFLSAEVEATALQPKAPYLGPSGAFESDKEKWDNAHIENYPYLEYDGEVSPQRQIPPQFPGALRETRMGALEAMKAIMGIYDASLGARTNETSGIAIEQRQEQGDNATYHYIDNMVRAIRYAGMCIVELLPRVYDAPRVARIIQPDGEPAMVAINQTFIDPNTYRAQPGIDLKAGRYDVVVKAGPSFQTQRQEAAKAINELIHAYPPIAQVAGDLLVKNMDFPDADKIAERLRPQQGQGPSPEQVQAMQAQMQGMQQALAAGKEAYDKLQQTVNEQKLQLMRKDLEKTALQMQVRDKQGSIAADVHDTNEETRRFVLDKIVELIGLQQKQTQPVVDEASQMESGVTALVQ